MTLRTLARHSGPLPSVPSKCSSPGSLTAPLRAHHPAGTSQQGRLTAPGVTKLPCISGLQHTQLCLPEMASLPQPFSSFKTQPKYHLLQEASPGFPRFVLLHLLFLCVLLRERSMPASVSFCLPSLQVTWGWWLVHLCLARASETGLSAAEAE